MRTLTAFIATPAPEGSTAGNRVTALRWAKRLRELGWTVRIATDWRGEPCDLLVALHARKSHASLVRHAAELPGAARIVALTGTDLYGDLGDPLVRESLVLATRIVVLQPRGIDRLPPHLRGSARVIWQSAIAPAARGERRFTACVLAHFRDIKDPLLAARAAALLEANSRWRIVHVGSAVGEWRERALEAQRATGERWRWLGPKPRGETLEVLASCDVLLLTSRSEGGANVVSEAIAAGVPVLSTRIDGSLGVLGDDYPGYFDVGDASGLAALLARCEAPEFWTELRARIAALRPLVEPAHEREAWRDLLRELAGPRW